MPRYFLTLIFCFAWGITAASAQVACSMEAKLCPDGSAVTRLGPDCEFAPCPYSAITVPGSVTGVIPYVSSVNIGLAKFLDAPVGSMPLDPQTVRYIIDHRSALNQRHLTVRAIVVSNLPPDTAGKTRLLISDTDNRNRDTRLDISVILPPGDATPYPLGETAEIPVTVWGNITGVVLEKN